MVKANVLVHCYGIKAPYSQMEASEYIATLCFVHLT